MKKLGMMAASVLALTLGAGAAMAQEVTLKLHQFLPAQANVPKLVLDVWADTIEKESGGRIKVERFASMALGGKPPELYDQAIDGVADVIWTVLGYTPGRFPQAEVFELPFMTQGAGPASCAYWTMAEKHMLDKEFKDVKVIGVWVHGPGMIHANKEIRTPEDLAGVKIRGGSRMVSQMLEQLGATPVGMPVTAVSEALSKGVLDATTIPWEVTSALKVPELVKNHTEFTGGALYNIPFVFAMNKAKYDSLPDDLKAVIDKNAGMDFSVFGGTTQEGADGPAREAAVKVGNNIVTLTEAETQVWRDKAAPIYEAWIADMKGKGIDGAALIAEAQALQTGACAGK
jgi:TRAP-type C4-dicarboxylate transport system substrate-binding protein